ncbi:alpha/beta hydrolase [Occallatibacter riparius]|uniref:Esterase family protein n=1 Tax=Occallatibacter riparius TaxID=1002689 RepID=A0A9J7BQU4_9BACT|nr:alpha/beta hydrolase family protein [Occallatibacter riparius]UWZ84937.1 esterase family protein [Occallatibacter riparius]
MNRARSCCLVVFGVCCLLAAGCRARGPVFVDRPRAFPGVQMQDVTFGSAALRRDITYRVYVPAQVQQGRKLPVIYLLHGGGGGFRDWSNYSDVGAYASRGYVLVMPDGGSSYWVNAAEGAKERYGDFLTQDLIADVEQRFPVATDRASRAVVGVSMGGYGAVELALRRPELFAFAGGISPALDVPSRKFSWRRWSQSKRFEQVFGADGSETRRAADPFVQVKTADPAKTPYLYITAGEQEPMLEPIRRFAGILQRRVFASEFHAKPGGHDWVEWDAQLPGCFERLMEKVSAR